MRRIRQLGDEGITSKTEVANGWQFRQQQENYFVKVLIIFTL
jgi:hypothetical protein